MIKKLKELPLWLQILLTTPLLFLNGFLLTILISYLEPLISFLIIASIITFSLELVINLLVQKGIKRSIAIALVLLSALIILISITFILVPILTQQLEELIINAPKWIEQANNYVLSELTVFDKFPINIDEIVQQVTNKISGIIKTIGGQTLGILLITINSVFNVLFILILTVFLLVGGDKFWIGVFSWIPQPWNEKVPNYLSQTFKDYFFSRLILVGIASVARTMAFIIIGVPSALLFAFGIGVASLVPFLGGLVSILITLLLVFKSGKIALLFLISAVIIDQITDNVLAPRFMGKLIGLNPVWLIISLFIGGKIAGVLGIFLAVPIASVIKKIVEDLRPTNIVRVH